MSCSRTPSRRVEENNVNEEFPPKIEQVPQGDQVHIVGNGKNILVLHPKITNGESREALITLAWALTTYVNMGLAPKVNVVERTKTFRLTDFVRMNPPIFLYSKVGKDSQEFLDGVYKVYSSMWVTSRKKTLLASY